MINHKPNELAPKLWVEFTVFMSAYYPLFLILFIRDISSEDIGIPFGDLSWNLYVSSWALFYIFSSSLAVIVVGPLMRNLLTAQEGGTAVTIIKADLIRGDMLNYTLPFLIGLFAFDYDSWQSIISLVVFLCFMFSFIHKEQISLLNPMFLLMGIRLYKVSYKEVGRDVENEKTALCLGEVLPSNEYVEIKETAGVHFLFPKISIAEKKINYGKYKG